MSILKIARMGHPVLRAKARAVDEPRVSGDVVAGFQLYSVAGNKFVRRDELELPVANHLRVRRRKRSQ